MDCRFAFEEYPMRTSICDKPPCVNDWGRHCRIHHAEFARAQIEFARLVLHPRHMLDKVACVEYVGNTATQNAGLVRGSGVGQQTVVKTDA